MQINQLFFNERYNPDEILHREKEIQKIEKTFDNFFGNLFLTGTGGTGKTSTIKHLMKKYPNKFLYASVQNKFTAKKVFQILFDSPKRLFDSLVDNLIDELINRPKVIIIDEVNKIYHSEISKFFDVLNAVYRATGVPIILISNRATLLEAMPEDARLTLFFQRVVFSPYNAFELKGIALQRINLLSDSIKFPEDSLNYICAKSARDGSARNVLFFVQKCILEGDYSLGFIDSLENEIKRQDWQQWVDCLKDFEKRFLRALVDIHIREVESKGSNGEILASQIQKELLDLSPQRVSQLITAFKEYGILETRYMNKGNKGGRYRLVSFADSSTFSKICDVI